MDDLGRPSEFVQNRGYRPAANLSRVSQRFIGDVFLFEERKTRSDLSLHQLLSLLSLYHFFLSIISISLSFLFRSHFSLYHFYLYHFFSLSFFSLSFLSFYHFKPQFIRYRPVKVCKEKEQIKEFVDNLKR